MVSSFQPIVTLVVTVVVGIVVIHAMSSRMNMQKSKLSP